MATSWTIVGPLTDGGSLPPFVIEAGGILRSSLELLNGDLNHADTTLAFVYADADPSNNGGYVKVGLTGTGSWTKIPPFGDGGGPVSKTAAIGLIGAYTVVTADDLGYREFDTSTQDGVILFDPTDSSIRDATQVWFRKTSVNFDLFLTTDGVKANALHVEHGTRMFSVTKAGSTLVF